MCSDECIHIYIVLTFVYIFIFIYISFFFCQSVVSQSSNQNKLWPNTIFLSCQIQSFLSSHPGEVVLLDFQHFHGLTSYDHTALKSLLRQVFSTTLAPIMHSPTLAYLARYKYQVGRELVNSAPAPYLLISLSVIYTTVATSWWIYVYSSKM